MLYSHFLSESKPTKGDVGSLSCVIGAPRHQPIPWHHLHLLMMVMIKILMTMMRRVRMMLMKVMMILTVDDQPDLAGCESPESATSSGGQH